MKCEQCKSDFHYTSLVKGKCLCPSCEVKKTVDLGKCPCPSCEVKKTVDLLKKEIDTAVERENPQCVLTATVDGRWVEASGGELVNMDRMAMVRITQRHGGLVGVNVLGAGINIALFTGSEEECAGYINSLKSKLGTMGR